MFTKTIWKWIFCLCLKAVYVTTTIQDQNFSAIARIFIYYFSSDGKTGLIMKELSYYPGYICVFELVAAKMRLKSDVKHKNLSGFCFYWFIYNGQHNSDGWSGTRNWWFFKYGAQ